MSDDAEERKRRAQARKDKIAARGADRLAKITGAARGEGEDGERFGTGGSAPPRPATPTSPSASTPPAPTARHTLPASATVSADPLDDPPEVDISTLRARQGFQSLPDDEPQMPDMLSALLGGNAGGAGQDAFSQQFAQMFGGGPGSTPVSIEPPRKKTWTDRLLPLVHMSSMVMLALFAVFILEPRLREGQATFDILAAFSKDRSSLLDFSRVDWNGWAALGRGKQALSDSSGFAKGVEGTWEAMGLGVAGVQLLYLFLTLELMLQGAAILIFKTRPPMPAILNSVMPYLPPNLAMYAHTGIKYWSLLGQVIDDLAVLVLSITGIILFAEYKQFGNFEKIKIE